MELELLKNYNREVNIERETKLLGKFAKETISSAALYVTKALPIQENVKDVLIDVIKAFKTKDFGEIVLTAVKSCVREGVEILGKPLDTIKSLKNVQEIAYKGGFKSAICATIDIFCDKYLKNNLFKDIVKMFNKDLKNFILGKEFDKKLIKKIDKVDLKQEEIIDLAKKWKDSYDKLDYKELNYLSNEIQDKRSKIFVNDSLDKSCKSIYHVTKIVNNKKSKLTPIQIEILKEEDKNIDLD